MAYAEHQQSAQAIRVACAVVTLSDTRTPQTDKSGAAIRELLAAAGHDVIDHRIVKDDPRELEPALATLLGRADVDAILTTGGTGVSRRDQTIAVIEKLLDTSLPGFGEIFRQLSYDQIGSGAMLSRAAAGVAKGKVVFAMPGSTHAVELAMTKLILPELRHLVYELRK